MPHDDQSPEIRNACAGSACTRFLFRCGVDRRARMTRMVQSRLKSMTMRTASPLSSLRQALSARRENICVEGRSGFDSGVSVFGYLFICLNILFFGWLVVADYLLYRELTREDYWVENLTALWFFLAGVLLFATAASERNTFRLCVYVLGGIAMMFAAGEEISWGQRIFGFTTPDFLIGINDEQEFNLHDISEVKIDRLPRYGLLTLCMVTIIAFFSKRDSVLGIPLPSALILLGAVATLNYYKLPGASIISVEFIFRGWMLLILLFVIYASISKRADLLIASLSTLVLVLAVSHTNTTNYLPVAEAREYLIGVVYLIIALELAFARSPKLLAILPRGAERRRLPPWAWLAACALVFACSVGLAFENVAIERKYQSVTSGAPAARSTFDVYVGDGEIIYAKQPCAFADVKSRFFLHLLPANVDDLPGSRKQYGFDNLDFRFYMTGRVLFGEKCMKVAPLPDYAIVSVRTGQYDDEGRLWEVEFPYRE